MFELKNNLETLEDIVLDIHATSPTSRDEFNDAAHKACGKRKMQRPANRELIAGYQSLLKKKRMQAQPHLEQFMRKAKVRSLSGVSIITSLLKPYACPGECVYCPTEVRMPKSYIASEPAAARALRLNFSPYDQMQRRIKMLEVNGHETDKIEFIVKGGTWNAYPLKYQYWFVYESFKACNDLLSKNPIGEEDEESFCKQSLSVIQEKMRKAQEANETARYRIIGVTLETRPDAITPKTIYHMREQGCTRVELGLQAPDDKILELVKRGHTVQEFRDAMKLSRDAGFKVDLHFMPDLPGSSPDHDIDMYKQLFSDDGLKPDMVKIYPNTVIQSAELYQWWKEGKYKPYGEEGLFRALLQMKKDTPRYCRISRLIRDIPSNEIYAGNSVTNLREELAAHLKGQGEKCVCLRCREISRQEKNIDPDVEPVLFIDEYETVGGKEYFLSFEDPDRIAVYGFLRLRIPTTEQDEKLIELIPEIKEVAFVRELHVYGRLLRVGSVSDDAAQHKGLGMKLLAAAEEQAKKHGHKKTAVISGVGVRKYYEKSGYEKEGTYMVKEL